MTFIYKRKNGFLGALYHKYISFIVTSKYIDRIVCFSKNEVEYYSKLFGVDKNKFVSITLGMQPVNNVMIEDAGFIFATGRSNRCYDFLVDTMNESHIKTIIACDTYHNETVSDNIKILNDCHGGEMQKLMARCHIVAIPLKDVNVSSGQLVILQAMSLGKPVICTISEGVKDYIRDYQTGLLINNDKKEWRNAITELYKNNSLYKMLSSNSKEVFYKRYSVEAMYENIALLVK